MKKILLLILVILVITVNCFENINSIVFAEDDYIESEDVFKYYEDNVLKEITGLVLNEADNEYYYVIGDTTINIAPGDDKKLRGIWGEQTTDEYNLIIQGSNAGRLSVEGPVYGSYDDSTKTLTIQGGTIECKFIRA